MKKYHYVYRITNLIKNKHYYGSRSSNKKPYDDIGIIYFSSSHDLDFIKDQLNNPLHYKYKVIKLFNDRKKAVSFESKLHKYFDVKNNINFYNRSNQDDNNSFVNTGVGFLYTLSHGWIACEEYNNNKEKYKIHDRKMKCYNNIENKYEVISYSEYDKSKYNHLSKNKIIVFDKIEKIKKYIDTSEYYDNKERYEYFNSGKLAAFDKINKCYVYVTTDEFHKNENLVHPTKDRVSVFDTLENKYLSISKELFLKNKDRYKGVNSGKINGSNNPNADIIVIYDNMNNIIFECNGNFKEVCNKNELPFTALAKTYRDNSFIKIGKRTSELTKLYEGWYARKM